MSHSGAAQQQQQHDPAAPAAKRPRLDGAGIGALGVPGSDLPVAAHRREILYLVENHATLILVGETGCGKSTQVGFRWGCVL